jgi:hypothetical protein
VRLQRRGCSRSLDRCDRPATGPPVGPIVGASAVAAAAARVAATAARVVVRDDLTIAASRCSVVATL